MQIVIILICAALGGALVGWVSGHVMERNPIDTPPILRSKIISTTFVLLGILIPSLVGYSVSGLFGVGVSLFVIWLANTLVGARVHKKL